MKFGLSEKEIALMFGVFHRFPQIKKIVIFGSRAMGNFKKGSDVDLAVMGKGNEEPASSVSRILNEETPLPYRFDIVHYETASSKELKQHIDEHGIPFYP